MDIKACCLLGHHTPRDTLSLPADCVYCWVEAQCSSQTAVWLPKMLKQCWAATVLFNSAVSLSDCVYVAEWYMIEWGWSIATVILTVENCKYWEGNLAHCHFVIHKSHTHTGLKSNPGLVWLEASDQLVLLIILPNIALSFFFLGVCRDSSSVGM
jgi:hypothetical protein